MAEENLRYTNPVRAISEPVSASPASIYASVGRQLTVQPRETAITKRISRLVAFHHRHECNSHAPQPGASCDPAWATSAQQPPLAAAFKDPDGADFPLEVKEGNIDPDMAFLALIQGTEVRLFAPSGEVLPWLSQGLSQLHLAVGLPSARKYVGALRRFLAAAKADRALLAGLEGEDSARTTIARLLHRAGCRLQRHRLPAGAVLVTAPDPLIATVETSLTTLSHCYDLLADLGKLGFANPVQLDPAHALRMAESGGRRRMRHFVLANRPLARPLTNDPHHGAAILAAADAFPPGPRELTYLIHATGARSGDLLQLTVRDWAKFGFGDRLDCPDKGSRGRRIKILYLDDGPRARLAAYIDGPRRDQTRLGLADLKRLAVKQPGDPRLDAPLFLNTQGRALGYSLFNDYYFRPAMRRLKIPATPHLMRHEHTTDGVLTIRQIARDDAHEEQLIAIFAELNGWRSGPEMVGYYSATLDDDARRTLLAQLREARSRAAPPPGQPDTDFAAGFVPPALAAFLARAGS